MYVDAQSTAASGGGDGGSMLRRALRAHWPLLVGLLIVAIPTLITLGQQTWSTEAGAHGPIVLATGLWLLSYNKIDLLHAGRQPWWTWLPLVAALPVYAFGRAFDFIFIEVSALYLIFVVGMVQLAGVSEVRRNLFALFYLAFIIPPPGWALDTLTSPLREFVSYISVGILHPMGFPIERSGVSLTIAQYQLLVEDACAGMNSITGLTAISLFYIYLMHRASWRYALVLVALIIPVAVFVNILRVIALILLTYYYGDAVAQGFMHVTTGMVLFALAVASIFLIDRVMQAVLARWHSGKEATA